ncbi:MAG TPA: GIY-YIG nuclease family protein [Saprospiraceae bacterium]|nr:GIY-YIG nuclease family protein [Saprospiraceae bacterium]
MYTVYVLKSKNADWFYIGMTTDFERRLADHNRGYNLSTKAKAPFILIFTELYSTSIEARNREKFLKNASGKRFIRDYFKKNTLE